MKLLAASGWGLQKININSTGTSLKQIEILNYSFFNLQYSIF
jgi:hypothetical protein